MKHFELEQQILDTWRITDDIRIMASGDTTVADFAGIAALYELKYQRMWETFEQLVAQIAKQHIQQSQSVPQTTLVGSCDDPVQLHTLAFKDETEQQIKLSYGDYDGEWILGIDGDNEQISVQLRDLNVLIDALKKLEKHTKTKTSQQETSIRNKQTTE
jgi:hypothetical protein